MSINIKAELEFLRSHESDLNESQHARLEELETEAKEAEGAAPTAEPETKFVEVSPEYKKSIELQEKLMKLLLNNQEAKPDQIDSDENKELMEKHKANEILIKELQAKASKGKVAPPDHKGGGNGITKSMIDVRIKTAALYGDSEVKQIHQYSDEMLVAAKLVKFLMGQDGNDVSYKQAVGVVKGFKHFKNHPGAKDNQYIKAMAGSATGEGLEWLPNTMSATFIDLVRLEAKVAMQFPTFNMPTSPYIYPIKTGSATMYYMQESTDDDASVTDAKKIPGSTVDTGQSTMTARKIAGRVVTSTELTEDSIVAIIPMIMDDLRKSFAEQLDNAIINGDRTVPHQDSDVTNAKDVRKAYVGLRKDAFAAAVSLASLTYEQTLKVRDELGRYGMNTARIFWLCGIKSKSKLRTIKDSSGANIYITAEKFGNSTNETGDLATYDGSDLVVSEFSREDLNASGFYDATTATYAELLCVNKDGFILGNHRDVTIKAQENIETDQIVIVGTMRKSFFHKYSAANAARGYGLVL